MKKKIYPFLVIIFFNFFSYSQQEINGDWYGVLNVQTMKLNLVFHIAQGENGYSTTMDSPDQGANGIPVSETHFIDDSITFTMLALNATYNGKLSIDETISGTFTQNGFAIPLTLSRKAEKKSAPKRPQEPHAPFPYLAQQVQFANDSASINLAGTLTLPNKTGKFPAVILITGSGPQDRNEEILGHKPFLVIADHLTRNGIAVLRYDDRGVGSSTGNFSGATTYDFAADARAAVSYLKSRPEIDTDKIGLIGHSEGGMIAPIIAADDKSIDFIVLLAGPGIPIDQMMLLQKKGIEQKMGIPLAQVEQGQKINTAIFTLVKTSQPEELLEKIKAYLKAQGITDATTVNQYVNTFSDPWLQSFLKYDPQSVLNKVTCPVLALNGSKDLQVPATENLVAIKNALAHGENKQVTIKELPGLNHLFQHTETGLVSEYGEIEETFSPQALTLITDWVLGQVK